MKPAARNTLALVSAAFALAGAAWIYAVGRSGFRLHAWLRALDVHADPIALPAFVRFNLPDALWQFAFAVCVLAIWRDAARTRGTWIAVTTPLVLGLGTEIGQALGVVEGVFDPLDAVAMAIAVLAGVAFVGLPSPSRVHGAQAVAS